LQYSTLWECDIGAERLAESQAGLEKIVEAAKPLYLSLDDTQKHKFITLGRTLVPVLNKQMFDRHVLADPAGEKVLHEKIAAGPEQPTLLYLYPPERLVKAFPELVIERLLVQAGTGSTQENVVTQEICGEKRFAASVQGFEDHLRIVAWLQVDRHHLKRVFQRLKALVQPPAERLVDVKWRVVFGAEEELRQLVVKE
jgi:hypothetical protein